MAKYKPGDIITVQPGDTLRKSSGGGSEGYTPRPWSGRVLTATDRCYICEGRVAQTSMSDWVREACKAAGLDPNQKIRLAYMSEVMGGEALTHDLYTPKD